MVVEWYHISDEAENSNQTRLEKDGRDVENASVIGSSKEPTLLDTSLLKRNRKSTRATKTVLELPCVVEEWLVSLTKIILIRWI